MAEMKSNVGTHKDVRVLPVPLFLVGYPGRDGREETKLAVVIGNDAIGFDVRFLAADTVQVSPELKKNVLVAAGIKDEDDV